MPKRPFGASRWAEIWIVVLPRLSLSRFGRSPSGMGSRFETSK